ncbi:MAG TPA: dihydrofolate reductase [Candidatus Odoribacter faecigallinarum]|uniref:Dihydrofolate reductase n=1 Tax=Candidatus Odoribacter faecigallinarum TaxID=2838706 RepID=A0A9D2ABZ9_9BACT|nr:dihydrofolate reductase [Candidatus Odoribacter faecigallinarum]
MKILVTYNLPRTPFNNLPADWELTFPQNEEMPREEIIRLLPEYDVLLTIFHSHSPMDREIIDAGKRLRLISNYGVGYNNIDTAYAREKGIAVTNTPRSVCNPTAELAMALMLALARRVAECDRRIRTEKESLWGTMKNLGASLENKTLGIVGMGNIGKNVARKAEAFGMRVIYYNRRTEVSGYRRVPLDTLLQEADFVSLHTPLTTETRHLIGARELSLMKPTAMLINTARGAVIDETALADALRQKRIAGAALDVFENEPHVTDVLYRLDNVVLTPHVGTGTIDTRIAMAEEALANIRNFFQGTPTNVVN